MNGRAGLMRDSRLHGLEPRSAQVAEEGEGFTSE
jgi:hypothetical protein